MIANKKLFEKKTKETKILVVIKKNNLKIEMSVQYKWAVNVNIMYNDIG